MMVEEKIECEIQAVDCSKDYGTVMNMARLKNVRY